MWFEEGNGLMRILVVGLPVYVALVIMLRLIGTRSLSKMNAFDVVVTIALGSALASSIMTEDLAGLVALGSITLLLGVQFIVAALAVRMQVVERLTKASPKLLLVRGEYLEKEMRTARIAKAAIRGAVRGHGYGQLSEVAAVILETDGSLSVIPVGRLGDASALEDVDMPAHARQRLP